MSTFIPVPPDGGSAITLVAFPQSGPVVITGPGASVTIANGNTWWPLGDCHTRLPMQLLTDYGSPVNLTGATITLSLRIRESYSFYKQSTGTAFILNASQGMFAWKFSSQDVAFPGSYKLLITATFPSDIWNTYEQDFVIAGLAG